MSLETIFEDFENYYEILDPHRHEEYIIYPLKSSSSLDSVLSIYEAEKQKIGWIQEQKVESVQQLEAINKGDIPILIPYLHQTEGGKQDRTIFEPILVPTGHNEDNPLVIPARCIERSRWGYATSRGKATTRMHSSSSTRMSSQMSYYSSIGSQTDVWHTVSSSSDMMALGAEDAPMGGYKDMKRAAFSKKTELKEYLTKLKPAINQENQVGIVVFFKGKFLGLETYGNSDLWNQFGEEILKGYLIDRYFLQNAGKKSKDSEKLEESDPRKILKTEFSKLKVSEEATTGTGKLFRFSKDNLEGISIFYDNQPVQFFAVKEQMA